MNVRLSPLSLALSGALLVTCCDREPAAPKRPASGAAPDAENPAPSDGAAPDAAAPSSDRDGAAPVDAGLEEGGTFAGGAIRIRDIQGRAHVGPLLGKRVAGVPGIVTFRSANGFYFQDPEPDDDDATSEALFVYTEGEPAVAVGDFVHVGGVVNEFRPGCRDCGTGSAAYANLTTTELEGPLTLLIRAHARPLPPPVIIGSGGRPPPPRIAPGAATTDVERGNVFDPRADALAFYESLEGMLIGIDDAVVIGPTVLSRAGRSIPLLANDGQRVLERTRRGGALHSDPRLPSERLLLTSTSETVLPLANVGDRFDGRLRVIVGYDGGSFTFMPSTALPPLERTPPHHETAPGRKSDAELSIATFNVENLTAGDRADKFASLARSVVHELGAPDLIALQEVQDDSGPLDDGTVNAALTLQKLTAAISAAGGPFYEAHDIDPLDGEDGGAPGGNIRQALLVRRDRGLTLVPTRDATATTNNRVLSNAGKAELAHNPGRIDPDNPAFIGSRKPLAAQLEFRGSRLFVIANHFTSKLADQPLFGRFQPPSRASELVRARQARTVAGFVERIIEADDTALVTVLGDMNDTEESPTIRILEGAGLVSLIETLPPEERYTYNYQGISQGLDHLLASPSLRAKLRSFYVHHGNADEWERHSDHDAAVAVFAFAPTP